VIQTNHWTPESACAILLGMIGQPYQLYIERRDPRQNMARFYALSIEETLFGQARLVRRWGRIGTTGRTVQHSFDSESEAVSLFLQLLLAKRLRGYQPRRIPLTAPIPRVSMPR
jgi:predicted DNA-binding WGR domain protein